MLLLLPLLPHLPHRYATWTDRCLHVNPRARPEFDEMLEALQVSVVLGSRV